MATGNTFGNGVYVSAPSGALYVMSCCLWCTTAAFHSSQCCKYKHYPTSSAPMYHCDSTNPHFLSFPKKGSVTGWGDQCMEFSHKIPIFHCSSFGRHTEFCIYIVCIQSLERWFNENTQFYWIPTSTVTMDSIMPSTLFLPHLDYFELKWKKAF